MNRTLNITVRPATLADRSEHLRMRVALWGADNTPELLNGEIDELHANGHAVLFAETDSAHVIGFVELSMRHFAESCDTRNVGYLEGWWVDPGHRRQGVGAALVDAAEQWARENGALEFASDCELDNAVSESAHKRLGFEETHRSIHFRKPLASDEEIRRASMGQTGPD